jgi:hypothetical protein
MSLNLTVKRGDKSWGYLVFFYSVIFGLTLTVVALIPFRSFLLNLAAAFFSAILLAYFCFYNAWSTNKIVGFLAKTQERENTFNVS